MAFDSNIFKELYKGVEDLTYKRETPEERIQREAEWKQYEICRQERIETRRRIIAKEGVVITLITPTEWTTNTGLRVKHTHEYADDYVEVEDIALDSDLTMINFTNEPKIIGEQELFPAELLAILDVVLGIIDERRNYWQSKRDEIRKKQLIIGLAGLSDEDE